MHSTKSPLLTDSWQYKRHSTALPPQFWMWKMKISQKNQRVPGLICKWARSALAYVAVPRATGQCARLQKTIRRNAECCMHGYVRCLRLATCVVDLRDLCTACSMHMYLVYVVEDRGYSHISNAWVWHVVRRSSFESTFEKRSEGRQTHTCNRALLETDLHEVCVFVFFSIPATFQGVFL